MDGFAPLLGMVDVRCAKLVDQRLQARLGVLLDAAEHMAFGIGPGEAARFAGISEKADRRHRVDQDEMIVRRQHLDRSVVHIGHALERQPALAALGARVGAFGHQFGAGHRRNAPGEPLRAFAHRVATEEQQHVLLLAQHAGGVANRMRIDGRRNGDGKWRADDAAFVPRGVAGQDQRRDRAGRHPRCLHRRGGVLADTVRRQHGAHECRHRPRPALGVGGQRRIERPVIGRLIANHIDDSGAGATRVVQIGEAVRKARSAMQ